MSKNKDIDKDADKDKKKSNNLRKQILKMYREERHVSKGTAKTYLDKGLVFVDFIEENYKVQSLKNISAKHIYSYVENQQEKGLSPSTIMGGMSAIRHWHDKSDSKNRLPGNEKLKEKTNWEKRIERGVSRAWSDREVSEFTKYAHDQGRPEVELFIKTACATGMRIHEFAKLTKSDIEKTLATGKYNEVIEDGEVKKVFIGDSKIVVVGKTGKVREVTVSPYQIEVLREVHARSVGEKFVGGNGRNEDIRKTISNFISTHRNKIQDKDRVSRNEARIQNRDNKIPAKAFLTPHGLRHTFARNTFIDKVEQSVGHAIDRFDNIQKQCRQLIKAGKLTQERYDAIKKETSELLGHNRHEVTTIYLKG